MSETIEDVAAKPALEWWELSGYYEARLMNPDNTTGVRFSLCYYPTCYRRGKWRLLIEVMGGEYHHDWGCFDDADQPMRYYHSEETAKREAEAIAKVLLIDFAQACAAKAEARAALAGKPT